MLRLFFFLRGDIVPVMFAIVMEEIGMPGVGSPWWVSMGGLGDLEWEREWEGRGIYKLDRCYRSLDGLLCRNRWCCRGLCCGMLYYSPSAHRLPILSHRNSLLKQKYKQESDRIKMQGKKINILPNQPRFSRIRLNPQPILLIPQHTIFKHHILHLIFTRITIALTTNTSNTQSMPTYTQHLLDEVTRSAGNGYTIVLV